jgi:hypothetical protein
MTMNRLRLLCLTTLLLGAACGTDSSGDGPDDPSGDQQQLEKDEIRAACAQAEADGTARPECPEVWLDDGVCDAFCQGGDSNDCSVHCDAEDDCNGGDGDGIVCAAIYIEPDGYCPPADEDPCAAFQDGDCQGDGIACAEIAYEKNGCCEAAPGCEHTDPGDCGIACTAELRERDGECNADVCDPDCQAACSADPGGDGDDGVACIEIQYPTNGECEAAAGCEYTDPDDCGVGGGSDPGTGE